MKAVLFDLDGTLLDTAPDFIVVLNQLRRQEQLPPLSAEAIREVVSNGARAMVQLAFGGDEGEPVFESLRQRFLDLYLANLAEHTVPFPGITDLLHKLAAADIAWGVVTNKPAAYTTPLMRAFAHLPQPSAIVCPDDVTQRKPHPEPIFLACSRIGCAPEEAVYVGDHARDIEAGKAAGTPTIACSYGYIDAGDSAANWNADHLVDSAEEIWPLLRKHYMKLGD
ncbi:N-acetylmuramic acid 6-phosphate phosphatase [Microbulbifer aestuariivivens]|uniref:N-acetylmuramic acid 6-phosphate phosphatase n=1 Tax=Microbulbifer aestuariivivens TaxID=1908308 RepID=A0ABP9WQ82_9GAMM